MRTQPIDKFEFREDLLAVLEHIRASVNSLRRLLDPGKREQGADEDEDQAQERPQCEAPAIAVVRTKVELPIELVDGYQTNQEKANRMQSAAFWINFGTLVAVAVYAGITYRMQTAMVETLKEAKRANDLNERLTKGTYGVTFDAEADVSPDGSIGLIFTNRGKVISASLHAMGNIVLETIPGYKPIGTPLPITVSDKQIGEGRSATSKVHFDQLTKAHLDRIAEWKEAVLIEGIVKYDNGFGDEISSDFCFLDVRLATGDGQFIMRPLPCGIAKEQVRIGPESPRSAQKGRDAQKK